MGYAMVQPDATMMPLLLQSTYLHIPMSYMAYYSCIFTNDGSLIKVPSIRMDATSIFGQV